MNGERKIQPVTIDTGGRARVETVTHDTARGQAPSGDARHAAAAALLKIEADLRLLRSVNELVYFAANETRLVTRAQQTFVFRRKPGGAPHVAGISAMAVIDRAAPLVAWIEAVVAALDREHGLKQAREVEAAGFELPKGVAYPGYPFRFLAWVPFLDARGEVIGGLLNARLTPWTEAELIVSRHVAGACAYALVALTAESRALRLPAWATPKLGLIMAGAMLALGLLPVSMSALAPVEVTPKAPFLVTAPLDGVVEQVLVQPNAEVKASQPLVRMADTVLRNRLEVAEREVLVADAKVKKASQLAFVDVRGRHDLGVAQAELHLRLAERDYAAELLARATIRAERDGVAVYSDPKDLMGRPVAVGERLMELADPKQLEFRIDLPASDSIVLHEGARVKVFLDSSPLDPIDAKLVRADFQARPRENQQLAYRLVAARLPSDTRPLRLGVRGTAQVYSSKVPLGFYLLRRPISAARQWLGI